jgi:hypothetical protein
MSERKEHCAVRCASRDVVYFKTGKYDMCGLVVVST